MTPWKYYIGEKVNILGGYNAIVINQHAIHSPNLYTVQEIQSGILIALYEDELQSMFEHDMDQLKLWGEAE